VTTTGRTHPAAGFRAPGRSAVHRVRYTAPGDRPGTMTTYCGMTVHRGGPWPAAAITDTATLCLRCVAAYDRALTALAPFAPGEPVAYTNARHPGLGHFAPLGTNACDITGYRWSTLPTHWVFWTAARTTGTPADRPWCLSAKFRTAEAPHTIGHHQSVTAAIAWTTVLNTGDGFNNLVRAIHAGTWDTQIPPDLQTRAVLTEETTTA
jgi:hypothetical protein